MRNLRLRGRDQYKVTERSKGKNRMRTWVSRIQGQMEVSRKRKITITPTLQIFKQCPHLLQLVNEGKSHPLSETRILTTTEAHGTPLWVKIWNNNQLPWVWEIQWPSALCLLCWIINAHEIIPFGLSNHRPFEFCQSPNASQTFTARLAQTTKMEKPKHTSLDLSHLDAVWLPQAIT